MLEFLAFLMGNLHEFITHLLERRPSIGYIAAATTAGPGVMSLVDHGITYVDVATKILGLVSVIIGLCVGIYTLRIQRRTWQRGQDQK